MGCEGQSDLGTLPSTYSLGAVMDAESKMEQTKADLQDMWVAATPGGTKRQWNK